jgi:hypothetical protein
MKRRKNIRMDAVNEDIDCTGITTLLYVVGKLIDRRASQGSVDGDAGLTALFEEVVRGEVEEAHQADQQNDESKPYRVIFPAVFRIRLPHRP